jgi:hypothetical protein
VLAPSPEAIPTLEGSDMFQLSPPRDAKVDQRWLNTGGNMDVLGTMDAAVHVCERRTTDPLPTLLTARHTQDTAHSTHM